ncbi:hypothetical protein R1sor_024028 [Riccia sorocarpa]|uniref:Uncharacterized protein n=1 Tax=Riccia sorocarpa TaxID=122646 RepID=A0ABD3GRI0_9MARC
MGREDVAYVDASGPAFFLNRSVSPASSCNSSSSNSEMKPRAMVKSLGAQKNAARHRMTKQDYEMIVTYLENPDHFAAINGCGWKAKITGNTLTKVTAFGHMAVTLCAQGFVKCSGVIMAKKVARPPALLRTAVLKNRLKKPLSDQTGRSTVDVETNAVPAPQQNRRPQQSRGDASVQSVDDVRSSGKTVRLRDRAPPSERRTSLITAYEEQVKEKLVLRKEAQDQKASFRYAILEDRRQAREQREREPKFMKEWRLCAGLERTAVVR